MENRSNVWNFDEVNERKKLSLMARFVIFGLLIMFLVTPLSTISPETFVIPKSAVDHYVEFVCPKGLLC
jgi:hypothetical protein